jgi:uncharacterized protein (UPF0264 family)
VKLLVSVTGAAEAIEAVAGGAHIIDVKDPARGALGAASARAVQEVRQATPPSLPLSVALGDEPFAADLVRAARGAVESGARFVKIGLSRATRESALRPLRALRSALPGDVALVVAGFADFERAGSPHPLDLPVLAESGGAEGCLIDTAVKDGLGLLHWLDEEALGAFVGACRSRGLLSALAGSLTPADLPRVASVGPDVVAVRGAACEGDRVTGRVSRARVEALARSLPATTPGRVLRDRPALEGPVGEKAPAT